MSRLDPFVRGLPDPERGRLRLTQWLDRLTSQETGLSQLESVPLLGRTFALLMTTSTEVCNMISRNPEMGLSALDLDTGYAMSRVRMVREEAQRLTAHTVSFAHRLDRLRFLKDKHTVMLAMTDVGGFLPPRDIWAGISNLAEALLIEAADAVWVEHAAAWNLPPQRSVGIVAFGKLGGGELNYSSDVDLAFVVPDDTPDEQMPKLQRFCERFRASVSDRMGRGALYRVDLRIRPFGSQGGVVNPMSVSSHYYQTHSEPWEHLALIRSRVLDGWPGMEEAWEAMRQKVSFASTRGEWVVDNLSDLRVRTTDVGGEDDLKRGRGGIRDVEFLVQLNQLLLGNRVPSLRTRHTIDALNALAEAGVLDRSETDRLIKGYTFLRQVEHRCQLRGGQQTHTLPEEPLERCIVAASMGIGSLEQFEQELSSTREEVHEIYLRHMPTAGTRAHKRISREVETWIGRLPEPDLYRTSLDENQDSLDRMQTLVRRAATLLPELPTAPSVTDEVMSGEILEEPVIANSIQNAKDLAGAAKASWLRIASHWALEPDIHASRRLVARATSLVQRLALDLDVTVLGMGSLANNELSWRSDFDVLIVATDEAAK
ncbi:MAG: hypothetical protein ABUL72_04345, partial [Armatimonadota bacterium]